MKCPKCGKETDRLLALSRRDNKTMICDSCGMLEALEDWANYLDLQAKMQDEKEHDTNGEL